MLSQPSRPPRSRSRSRSGSRAALLVFLTALPAFSACGSFQDPSIVVDLRILAAVTEPPEQVVPFDPQDPTEIPDFQPFDLCALVADPGVDRGLSWSLSVCPQKLDLRCDPDRPSFVAATGHIDDPDSSATPQQLCATVPAGGPLLGVLRDAIEHDSLAGFGGIDLNLALTVTPDGAPDQAVYGAKAARFSAKLPAERVANSNPTLDRIDVDLPAGGDPVPLPLGRCVDQPSPLSISVGQRIHLTPVEPPGARETYVVPTFEGGSRTFTENLRYQWLAGDGDWTRASTGGTRDAAGNEPPLDTEWKTPTAAQLADRGISLPLDVPLWVIQRDERGGAAWFESCIRVVP
ncbi:MAG TPA: hypothetical protein VHE35_06725 [Kofleriaceae bacterium]|nr:hypothetical protein [Kofleriaceae bacterium]